MSKAKKKEEEKLINDPGESLQERVSRVIEEVLSGQGPRGRKTKALLLPEKAKTPRTTEAISRALVAAGGRISYASIVLGCTPEGLRKKIRESEQLTALLKEVKEFRLDIAESKLDQRVLADKWPAISFALETQGKNRGYTKRTEVTGAEGSKLIFEFSDGTVDKDA